MTTQELNQNQEELKEMADTLAETEPESFYDAAVKNATLNNILTQLIKIGYEKNKIIAEAESKMKSQFANFLHNKYELLSI